MLLQTAVCEMYSGRGDTFFFSVSGKYNLHNEYYVLIILTFSNNRSPTLVHSQVGQSKKYPLTVGKEPVTAQAYTNINSVQSMGRSHFV